MTSEFCTNCGEPLSNGKSFCTSCGKPTENSSVSTPPPAPPTTRVSARVAAAVTAPVPLLPSASIVPVVEAKTRKITKSRLVKGIAALIVLAGAGGGAFMAGKSSINQEKIRDDGFTAGRSEGYDSGFDVGKASIDQEKIRDDGFTAGRSEGYDSGYDVGKSAGRTEGTRLGCLALFDFSDGSFDYVTPYNPDSFSNRYPSGYYASRLNC